MGLRTGCRQISSSEPASCGPHASRIRGPCATEVGSVFFNTFSSLGSGPASLRYFTSREGSVAIGLRSLLRWAMSSGYRGRWCAALPPLAHRSRFALGSRPSQSASIVGVRRRRHFFRMGRAADCDAVRLRQARVKLVVCRCWAASSSRLAASGAEAISASGYAGCWLQCRAGHGRLGTTNVS